MPGCRFRERPGQAGTSADDRRRLWRWQHAGDTGFRGEQIVVRAVERPSSRLKPTENNRRCAL